MNTAECMVVCDMLQENQIIYNAVSDHVSSHDCIGENYSEHKQI